LDFPKLNDPLELIDGKEKKQENECNKDEEDGA